MEGRKKRERNKTEKQLFDRELKINDREDAISCLVSGLIVDVEKMW